MKRDRDHDHDPEGWSALFSAAPSLRPLGMVTLECSACREETPVTGVELARLAFPFFLVLPPRREHWAFLRCPACGQRTWIRPHLRL
jgi:hypothetical protein